MATTTPTTTPTVELIHEADFFGQVWSYPKATKRPDPLPGYVRDPSDYGNDNSLSLEDWDEQEHGGDAGGEQIWDEEMGTDDGGAQSDSVEKALNRKHGFKDENITNLFKEFASFEERTIGSDVAESAQKFIQQQYKEYGLLPLSVLTGGPLSPKKGGLGYKQAFTFPSKKDKNVTLTGINFCGCVLGGEVEPKENPSKRPKKDKDAMDVDTGHKGQEIIVITAHYDIGEEALESSDPDNSSGVLALLTLVQHFKHHPPSHNIVFVATDGSFADQAGMSSFLSTLAPSIRDHIVLNINLDILNRVSLYGQDVIHAIGGQYYPLVITYIEEAVKQRTLKAQFHDTSDLELLTGSDSKVFHESYTIPFIHFGLSLSERADQRTTKKIVAHDSKSDKYFLRVIHFIVDVVENFDKKLTNFHESYVTQKETIQKENKRRWAKFDKEQKEKEMKAAYTISKQAQLASFRAGLKKKAAPPPESKSPNRRRMMGGKNKSKDLSDNKDAEKDNDEKGSEEKEDSKQTKDKDKDKDTEMQGAGGEKAKAKTKEDTSKGKAKTDTLKPPPATTAPPAADDGWGEDGGSTDNPAEGWD